jgi:hypothetical protein
MERPPRPRRAPGLHRPRAPPTSMMTTAFRAGLRCAICARCASAPLSRKLGPPGSRLFCELQLSDVRTPTLQDIGRPFFLSLVYLNPNSEIEDSSSRSSSSPSKNPSGRFGSAEPDLSPQLAHRPLNPVESQRFQYREPATRNIPPKRMLAVPPITEKAISSERRLAPHG